VGQEGGSVRRLGRQPYTFRTQTRAHTWVLAGAPAHRQMVVDLRVHTLLLFSRVPKMSLTRKKVRGSNPLAPTNKHAAPKRPHARGLVSNRTPLTPRPGAHSR
jgi:hypothetical protein